MTTDEQWAQINYPTFFGAAMKKIQAARVAMANAEVTASKCNTHLNGVPIGWNESGDKVHVAIGESGLADLSSLVDITIPIKWLEA